MQNIEGKNLVIFSLSKLLKCHTEGTIVQQHETKTLSESKHFGKRKQGSLGDENMRPISKYRVKVTQFAGLFPN